MKVSIVIPTLNSARTLPECLDAILAQDYPREETEIIVADAGSSDATREIAERRGVAAVVANPLKTGEAGKTAGIKAATGEFIALIDSDNILPDSGWLTRMMAPFAEPDIFASEPIDYSCRTSDPALTRYFAHLGMNDPICLFTGNYDRTCAVTGRWTDLPVPTQDKGGYLKLALSETALPTIGANGFIFRKDILDGLIWFPYFFDIDIVHQAVHAGRTGVAKVKTGIIHLYCARLSDFRSKQKRRIRDFLYFAQDKQRTYPWDKQKKTGILLFALATVTVVPLLLQTLRGYRRRPDSAWLYHVPVCWVTLFTYGIAVLCKLLGFKQTALNRSTWQK